VATSTKVLFKLSSLREKALTAINERIDNAEEELERFNRDDTLIELRREWRKRQDERIDDLCSRLDEISDEELSRFKLDELPKIDQWEKSRARQRLNGLRVTREQMIAKADSLVADEDGNIGLTKTQLQEFFGI
jgi:predicted  nucleic acid-binding Zn-ribbon protein